MASPSVHILMPVYNVEKFIKDSILSVLSQSYLNLKLLILNDGSTDGTNAIIDKLVQENPSKILLNARQENCGIFDARKALIAWSKKLDRNAYLLWLDGDDKYTDKDFVKDVIERMIKTKAEICLFYFSVAYEDESQRLNAAALNRDKEKSLNVIKAITHSPHQAVSPCDLPNLLEFSSLGWTKCYAPTVSLPLPANCPFGDFVYMASLLKVKTITALSAERAPIEYLRRSSSICGQRTAKNFEYDVPTQLREFFKAVCLQSLHDPKRLCKLMMAKNFIEKKIDQYELTLNNAIQAKFFLSINDSTLVNFLIEAEKLKKEIHATLTSAQLEVKHRSSSGNCIKYGIAALTATGLFFIGYKSKSLVDKRTKNHINGIEGFWSYAKHILYNDRGVSKYHFPMYLKEIEYRYNHRGLNLFKQFINIFFGYVSP